MRKIDQAWRLLKAYIINNEEVAAYWGALRVAGSGHPQLLTKHLMKRTHNKCGFYMDPLFCC